MNPMLEPRIAKVVVNSAVGQGGEDLRAAEQVVEELTGRTPVRTRARQTVPAFDIKQGEPIGCMVTLRGEDAEEFLGAALDAREGGLEFSKMDDRGNFAFGVDEHTNFDGVEYDTEIGIHGLDVSVEMERPGYRVKRRQIRSSKVGEDHVLSSEDTATFLEERFEVEVER